MTETDSVTLKIARDIHNTLLREKEKRPGMSIQWIADEVMRAGFRVKRIDVEGGGK